MTPLCVGSRCWTMTNAMPLLAGTRPRNCSRASSPPAEAPMPTMGNDALAGGAGVIPRAALASPFGRRDGEDFCFMRLFHALPELVGIAGATLPDGDAQARNK